MTDQRRSRMRTVQDMTNLLMRSNNRSKKNMILMMMIRKPKWTHRPAGRLFGEMHSCQSNGSVIQKTICLLKVVSSLLVIVQSL